MDEKDVFEWEVYYHIAPQNQTPLGEAREVVIAPDEVEAREAAIRRIWNSYRLVIGRNQIKIDSVKKLEA